MCNFCLLACQWRKGKTAIQNFHLGECHFNEMKRNLVEIYWIYEFVLTVFWFYNLIQRLQSFLLIIEWLTWMFNVTNTWKIDRFMLNVQLWARTWSFDISLISLPNSELNKWFNLHLCSSFICRFQAGEILWRVERR